MKKLNKPKYFDRVQWRALVYMYFIIYSLFNDALPVDKTISVERTCKKPSQLNVVYQIYNN